MTLFSWLTGRSFQHRLGEIESALDHIAGAFPIASIANPRLFHLVTFGGGEKLAG
ncbi:MAG: hypothetical protein M3Y93_11865 [Pseudomonadota bacterium]|nr:hypothetical protein [Pseudomonadota bacterium]